MNCVIHLFNDGLRIHDNPSLHWALQTCDVNYILPLFVYDPSLYKIHDKSEQRFLLETLMYLNKSLQKLGLGLYVETGTTTCWVEQIIKKLNYLGYNVQYISCEQSIIPEQQAMRTKLQALNIQYVAGSSNLLCMEACSTLDEMSHMVLTKQKKPTRQAQDTNKRLPHNPFQTWERFFDTWDHHLIDKRLLFSAQPIGGEPRALALLYSDKHDETQLLRYVNLGSLSPRYVWEYIRSRCPNKTIIDTKQHAPLLSLLKREFYKNENPITQL